MSVGLMDGDFATYVLVPFNLEIMKLSAYYKRKRQLVSLTTNFEPNYYSKFIYRKDYIDGIYPKDLMITPNVEYGGLSFSNNIYIPMPREIEIMKPDTSIYSKQKKLIESYACEAKAKKIFQNMIEGEHCRLSLDGKTIWEEYPKQFKVLKVAKNLIFHDYDLGKVKGSFDEVKHILLNARNDGTPTRVGMKFPVQVENGKDLLDWSTLRSNSTFFSLQYNGFIDNQSFIEWVSAPRETAIYEQMIYNVTSSQYEENQFVKEILPKIFKQIIISRSYRASFSLTFNKGYFKEPMWEKVIQLFNFYLHNCRSCTESKLFMLIGNDTLYNFARNSVDEKLTIYGKENFTKQEIREIFQFVRENNIELFNDFYNCSVNSLGGTLL